MNWFETSHCRSGAHCHACRTSAVFRASIVRAGLVDAVEFKCPFDQRPPAFEGFRIGVRMKGGTCPSRVFTFMQTA